MKIIIAAPCAVVISSLVFAAVAGAAHEARSAVVHKPTATVSFTTEVEARGKYFKKREVLTVTLSSSTIDARWSKKVHATATGTFTATFGAIALNSCDQYTLRIVGSLKSRFTTSHAFVPC